MFHEPREEEILVDSEGGAGVSPDGQISGGGILHDGLVERGESVLAPQRPGECFSFCFKIFHVGERRARGPFYEKIIFLLVSRNI